MPAKNKQIRSKAVNREKIGKSSVKMRKNQQMKIKSTAKREAKNNIERNQKFSTTSQNLKNREKNRLN